MVRKIGTDTNTTRVILVLTIMPAFEENGGRYYGERREYSYGGYWFYAGAYPPWFYQRDVYFVMGADGLWYAVAYDDPSLKFQVDID